MGCLYATMGWHRTGNRQHNCPNGLTLHAENDDAMAAADGKDDHDDDIVCMHVLTHSPVRAHVGPSARELAGTGKHWQE